MQYSGWLAEGIDPAAHGVPWGQALNIYHFKPEHLTRDIRPKRLIDAMIIGHFAAFAKPLGNSEFRFIDVAEWNMPSTLLNDGIKLGHLEFTDIYVHFCKGLPLPSAAIAFISPDVARRFIKRLFEKIPVDNSHANRLAVIRAGGHWADAPDGELYGDLQYKCQTGELIISGLERPINTGSVQLVDQRLGRFDLKPEVLETDHIRWLANEIFGCDGMERPIWTLANVIIRQPLPKMREQAEQITQAPKNQGGRPKLYDWEMFERLAGRWLYENSNTDRYVRGEQSKCIDWIMAMRIFENGDPGHSTLNARVKAIFDWHKERDEQWEEEKRTARERDGQKR